MSNPLEDLLMQAAKAALYPPNSRYHGAETKTLETPDGHTAAYLNRRFAPSAESLSLVQEHSVVQGDRLDLLAASYFGDPELFWRICDANNAMSPDELTETVGRLLRITLPQGIAGGSNG